LESDGQQCSHRPNVTWLRHVSMKLVADAMRRNVGGNVRQLRNEIQRAVAMSPSGGSVDPEHLSADLTAPAQSTSRELSSVTAPSRSMQPGNLAVAVEEIERGMISATLERTRGNISETARVLGLTRRGLYLKMRRLGLDAVAADT